MSPSFLLFLPFFFLGPFLSFLGPRPHPASLCVHHPSASASQVTHSLTSLSYLIAIFKTSISCLSPSCSTPEAPRGKSLNFPPRDSPMGWMEVDSSISNHLWGQESVTVHYFKYCNQAVGRKTQGPRATSASAIFVWHRANHPMS